MPPAILLLILLAAILHAGWNLLLKQAGDRYLASWWLIALGFLFLSPSFFFFSLPALSLTPYVLISAILESLYFLTLITAYQQGDFSLVYPIARGAAPAMLALWSFLFLGERLSNTGLMGIALIVLGLMVVGSNAWWTQSAIKRAISHRTILLALSVALLISLYSFIDAAAVRQTHPLPYVCLVFGLTALILLPMIVARYGLSALTQQWRLHWPRLLQISLMNIIGYTTVVAVYSLGKISYAGALRELSVVFAACAGWLWLGESFGLVRVIGAAIIFAGILLIALMG